MNDLSDSPKEFSGDQMLTLSDGRDLGYVTSGTPDGIPVFFFHGTPGSRVSFSPEDRIALMPGVFMIFPERPGYGISSPKPGRTLLDWPDDVVELADHLETGRFAVAGVSGGGPNALACAWKYPKRVFAAFTFASPTPIRSLKETKGMILGNRLNFYMGSRMPWLVRILMRSAAKSVMKDPKKFMTALTKQMCASDQALLRDESLVAVLARDLKEAYRQGSDAQFIDGQLTMSTRPWGFSLSDIQVPVHAWHGEEDTLVPVSMTARFDEMPEAKVRHIANAGHLITEHRDVVDDFENTLQTEWLRCSGHR